VEIGERALVASATFEVRAAEALGIIGPSGSGKTTLLLTLCGIRSPHRGLVLLDGASIFDLSRDDRASLRLHAFGFVFQTGELLPELTALENVALPARLAGSPRASAEESARQWLRTVGLEGREPSSPAQLSVGERQRVAVARALVNEPQIILADEPTGALDETATGEIAGLLIDVARQTEAACVIVTHDPAVAARCDRVLRLRAGRLENAATSRTL
jgi:putative ABC transport system ATP-binding protein